MSQVQIDTAQNVSLDVEVAGLGDRLIAAIIDYAILMAYGLFMIFLLFGVVAALVEGESVPSSGGDSGEAFAFLFLFILFSPIFFYFLLCEIFMDGQSIGKRYMQIKVTNLDGTPASIGSYLIRWLLRIVDVTIGSGVVAVTCILVTGTGQRLGDLAAGTTVVKHKTQRTALDDVALDDVDPDYVPQFDEVRRLSDDDVKTAQDVLDALKYQSRSTETENLGRRVKCVLERKMGVTSDLSPREFLDTIIRDYAATFR